MYDIVLKDLQIIPENTFQGLLMRILVSDTTEKDPSALS